MEYLEVCNTTNSELELGNSIAVLSIVHTKRRPRDCPETMTFGGARKTMDDAMAWAWRHSGCDKRAKESRNTIYESCIVIVECHLEYIE